MQGSGHQPDVSAIAERARAAGRLGLDTEFMPEGRYRPLLCLVQVAAGGEVSVLDPLDGLAHTPLAEVLADPAVEVVLHAGRQDVAILRREGGTAVSQLLSPPHGAGVPSTSA